MLVLALAFDLLLLKTTAPVFSSAISKPRYLILLKTLLSCRLFFAIASSVVAALDITNVSSAYPIITLPSSSGVRNT